MASLPCSRKRLLGPSHQLPNQRSGLPLGVFAPARRRQVQTRHCESPSAQVRRAANLRRRSGRTRGSLAQHLRNDPNCWGRSLGTIQEHVSPAPQVHLCGDLGAQAVLHSIYPLCRLRELSSLWQRCPVGLTRALEAARVAQGQGLQHGFRLQQPAKGCRARGAHSVNRFPVNLTGRTCRT